MLPECAAVRRRAARSAIVAKQIAKVAEMAFAGLLGGCWVASRTTHACTHTTHTHTRTGTGATSDEE